MQLFTGILVWYVLILKSYLHLTKYTFVNNIWPISCFNLPFLGLIIGFWCSSFTFMRNISLQNMGLERFIEMNIMNCKLLITQNCMSLGLIFHVTCTQLISLVGRLAFTITSIVLDRIAVFLIFFVLCYMISY